MINNTSLHICIRRIIRASEFLLVQNSISVIFDGEKFFKLGFWYEGNVRTSPNVRNQIHSFVFATRYIFYRLHCLDIAGIDKYLSKIVFKFQFSSRRKLDNTPHVFTRKESKARWLWRIKLLSETYHN